MLAANICLGLMRKRVLHSVPRISMKSKR